MDGCSHQYPHWSERGALYGSGYGRVIMSRWRKMSEKPKNYPSGEPRWVLVEHKQPKNDMPYPQPFYLAYWDEQWKCWIDDQGNDPMVAYMETMKPIRWMNLPKAVKGE